MIMLATKDDQESCIREFYKVVDDKITFRKSLT
jgi:hypothetical protein